MIDYEELAFEEWFCNFHDSRKAGIEVMVGKEFLEIDGLRSRE